MTTSSSPNSESLDVQDANRRYRLIKANVSDGIPITLLHIGEEDTFVVSGRDAAQERILSLDIGSHKTAADYFRQQVPTPLEMENAISVVEDEVTRSRSVIVGGSVLYTTDPAIREIARIAGAPEKIIMVLGLDQVERVFDRLAAVVLGKPASQEGIPPNADFAARLLILREFMHHLQFESITITT